MSHYIHDFHLFPKLPPELRIQIWDYTLPDTLPVMYYHDINPDREIICPIFTYHPSLPDPFHFKIPILEVNREAHEVATSWMRRYLIKPHPDPQWRQKGAFTCSEDRERPILAIPRNLIHQFIHQIVFNSGKDDAPPLRYTDILRFFETYSPPSYSRLSRDLFQVIMEYQPRIQTEMAVVNYPSEHLLFPEQYGPETPAKISVNLLSCEVWNQIENYCICCGRIDVNSHCRHCARFQFDFGLTVFGQVPRFIRSMLVVLEISK